MIATTDLLVLDPSDGAPHDPQSPGGSPGGGGGDLLVQAYDADPDHFLKVFDRLGSKIQTRITFAVAAALGRTVGEVDAAWVQARLGS
jgi:hypothetical protein